MQHAWEKPLNQHPEELATFVKLLRRENVRSYLEIGSKWGNSLWNVGQALEVPSLLVCVDMPRGTKDWSETQASLQMCASYLQQMGHRVVLLWGNSQDEAVVKQVKLFGRFDAVLIDADHRLPGVTRDWENYGPLARLVCFHDISAKVPMPPGKTPIDVPLLWGQLKKAHKHIEIRRDPHKANGIGVLWRGDPS